MAIFPGLLVVEVKFYLCLEMQTLKGVMNLGSHLRGITELSGTQTLRPRCAVSQSLG